MTLTPRSSRPRRMGKVSAEKVMTVAAQDTRSYKNVCKREPLAQPVKYFQINGQPFAMRNGELVPMVRKNLAKVFAQVENFGVRQAIASGLVQVA